MLSESEDRIVSFRNVGLSEIGGRRIVGVLGTIFIKTLDHKANLQAGFEKFHLVASEEKQ